ncbi:MAG: GTPase Era [Helicobacter sp.]|nr:GTPase Era [Helicobacter sp.]
MTITKAGFVAILGRPNAGKSSLLNALCRDHLALVSHKANATRKRLQCIVIHNNAQIIFVDTPGIHHQEKLLNAYMLGESLRALGDCDICVFVAPIHDSLAGYKEFLQLAHGRKHLLALTKIDTMRHDEVLARIAQYQPLAQHYEALVPLSAYNQHNLHTLLDLLAQNLPDSPALFDTEIATTENLRSLYKEMIREAIFEFMSDEIPYESDVLIKKFIESPHQDSIAADIVVCKPSQKAVVIGKNGSSIRRIGLRARKMMEEFGGKKIRLDLFVRVDSKWCKDRNKMRDFGYNVED